MSQIIESATSLAVAALAISTLPPSSWASSMDAKAATKIQAVIRGKQARLNKSKIIKWILMQLYLFKNKDKNIDNISNLLEDTKDSLNEHYKKQFEDYLNEIIR